MADAPGVDCHLSLLEIRPVSLAVPFFGKASYSLEGRGSFWGAFSKYYSRHTEHLGVFPPLAAYPNFFGDTPAKQVWLADTGSSEITFFALPAIVTFQGQMV
jgi:hypothetical protein